MEFPHLLPPPATRATPDTGVNPGRCPPWFGAFGDYPSPETLQSTPNLLASVNRHHHPRLLFLGRVPFLVLAWLQGGVSFLVVVVVAAAAASRRTARAVAAPQPALDSPGGKRREPPSSRSPTATGEALVRVQAVSKMFACTNVPGQVDHMLHRQGIQRRLH